jgi:acetyl-CoA carboxylase carboxyl transferase subunit alpha
LWRSWDYKEVAADALKLTAEHMLSFGLIDEIIPEPLGGAHTDPEKMCKTIKAHIRKELNVLMDMDPDERVNQRIAKYEKMGRFEIEEEVIPSSEPSKSDKKSKKGKDKS